MPGQSRFHRESKVFRRRTRNKKICIECKANIKELKAVPLRHFGFLGSRSAVWHVMGVASPVKLLRF